MVKLVPAGLVLAVRRDWHVQVVLTTSDRCNQR
jgi:hypothetical protein